MKEDSNWRPNAPLAHLIKRATLSRQLRRFFEERSVLEVVTPVLSKSSGTDVNLYQWCTSDGRFLHTSPEFPMKRLLAAGSGDIFQLCQVFRRDELGVKHNPEFSMIEWYRVGWDEHQLMTEVADLIRELSDKPNLAMVKYSYAQCFNDANLPDPHRATIDSLRAAVTKELNAECGTWSRNDCLDALMSMVIEPKLPEDVLCFVHQYPASQAALAQYEIVDSVTVGRRFELYWKGMELANGYFELVDANEQRERFDWESEQRKNKNLSMPVMDQNFLSALKYGMPECSGVALGFDRLIMAIIGTKDIQDVLTFSSERA